MNRHTQYVLWHIAFLFLISSSVSGANGLKFLKRFDNKHGTTSGVSYSGSWGYVGPDGREYAILGTAVGTAIIEITDTGNIHEIAHIPGPTSIWREMRTYKNRLYIVSEGGGGTTIVDLSNLPTGVRTVKNFTYTSGGKNTSRSHTIEIFDGYMYLNGCGLWSPGGVLIFSLADPDNPQFVGQYQPQYVHDSYVRHDTIFAASVNSGGGVNIASVVSKSSPAHIGKIAYAGSGTHNVWTTTDGRYAITTDEIGTTPKTLKIWDLQSLPIVPTSPSSTYQFSPLDIEHNVFVRGRYAYTAWYTAGIVVVDVRTPTAPVTAGFYDTSDDLLYPPGNYDGVWAVYPYFWSGKVTAGDMQNGLYVFSFDSLQARTPVSLQSPATLTTLCDNSPITFHWTRAADPGADPLQYLVGLKGPNIDTLFNAASETTFTLTNPGFLKPGTFSWYIITKDEANEVSSQDTFNFVRPAPEVTAPNGGELVKIFAQVNLTWTWACPDSVELSLSTDNGSHWNPIARLSSSQSSYLWAVPIAPTTHARIRVSAVSDSGRADVSDTSFTIYNSASIAITSPNGGELWPSGIVHPITWANVFVDHIMIDYSTDGGTDWITLAADTLASIGSYDWTTPFVGTSRALVRITQKSNPTVVDVSDAFFSIASTSYQVGASWNLVSLPVVPDNKIARFNYPGARSPVFKYAGSYSQTDSVEQGTGYWVKYASSSMLYAIGQTIERDTLPVSQKWKMIGTLSNSISAASIVSTPQSMALSPYYGYTPEVGYEIADSLFPGKGYWVRASEPGSLILSSSGGQQPVAREVVTTVSINKFDFFTLEDRSGNKRLLYFCMKNQIDGDLIMYELPPEPPVGIFDARYASRRVLEVVEAGKEAPITIASASYPVRISWDSRGGTAGAALLVDDRKFPLKSSGSVQIHDPRSRVRLGFVSGSASELPKGFSLAQNYPNPFNPETQIKYSLPALREGMAATAVEADAIHVKLTILDLLGREVALLVDQPQSPGDYSLTWDAAALPSGMYFYRLEAVRMLDPGNSFVQVRKMLLMK